MWRRGRTTDAERSRAQTTIDYAIGVGIFLLAIAWVIGTVPQIVQPFDDAQDRPLVANRAADRLAGGALSESGEQTVLTTACIDGFFDNTSPPSGCGYAVGPTHTAVGVGGQYDVNVTLLHDGTVATLSDGSDATRGDEVPNAGRVVAARRSVLVDGELHQLLVRVW